MSKGMVPMVWNSDTVPSPLVDTGWVSSRLDDPMVRIVEVNSDGLRYDRGHIPGAVEIDWRADLQNDQTRDVATQARFETVLAACGISRDTTVVFYGDCGNVSAAYSYWIFKLFGHPDCRMMDGGRKKWNAEGRPWSQRRPVYPPVVYTAQPSNLSIRAFRDQVLAHIYADRPLVDARLPEEYLGAYSAEHQRDVAQRSGHIPTARNIPWTDALDTDGRFQDSRQLRELYTERGIGPDQPVITYSGAGERSAHTWFVLSQLLGYPDVRNYDGSWSEWGSLIRAPIERDGANNDPARSNTRSGKPNEQTLEEMMQCNG